MKTRNSSRLTVFGRRILLCGLLLLCVMSCKRGDDSQPPKYYTTVSGVQLLKIASKIYVTQDDLGDEIEAFVTSNYSLEDDVAVWRFRPVHLEHLLGRFEANHALYHIKTPREDYVNSEFEKVYADVLKQFMREHPKYSIVATTNSSFWGRASYEQFVVVCANGNHKN